MNIIFLTQKLPYSQICGTKVGPTYKKRRQRERFEMGNANIMSKKQFSFGGIFGGPRAPAPSSDETQTQSNAAQDYLDALSLKLGELKHTFLKNFFEVNIKINHKVKGLKRVKFSDKILHMIEIEISLKYRNFTQISKFYSNIEISTKKNELQSGTDSSSQDVWANFAYFFPKFRRNMAKNWRNLGTNWRHLA